MTKLVIHPATKKVLDAYLRTPAHALLLSGDEGVGLGTIALYCAATLSGNEKLVTVIAPEKNVIPIDRIRQLYEQTRSIQSGKRVIILDDADAMSVDAQNALLKLLEEPVHNVHFILTTHHLNQLLMTIRSRAQVIDVQSVSEQESKALLADYDLTDTKRLQAMFLASGKPAELIRLAEDEAYFEKQSAVITDARTFIQSDSYERLKVIKKYTDRNAALVFLDMCGKLLTFTLFKQRNYAAADSMELIETVIRRIDANAHVRTQLAYLVTKLP